ncbi:hypothetical protein Tcan_15200 [Toxocara canis]|uniref:Uncharacterized protein n=2 Tax=Toxocara canis TaxID=6265 RepID=A0A0B2UVC4_TOXCA|nr:hypothetical protein Tcan_15200 [Toxocara canis]VDM51179.1 unnamed protein product [Toxocara canis]
MEAIGTPLQVILLFLLLESSLLDVNGSVIRKSLSDRDIFDVVYNGLVDDEEELQLMKMKILTDIEKGNDEDYEEASRGSDIGEGDINSKESFSELRQGAIKTVDDWSNSAEAKRIPSRSRRNLTTNKNVSKKLKTRCFFNPVTC